MPPKRGAAATNASTGNGGASRGPSRSRAPCNVPDPWTAAELAEHLAKQCGTQFSTGPAEPTIPRSVQTGSNSG